MNRILSFLMATILMLTSSITAYAGETNVKRISSASISHHNHCICGGQLTVGDHTTHQTCQYQPWNGKSDIPYKNNVAYVYLTGDVDRETTLRIGGNKILYLCLNGHTVRKVGGDRVINIVSGGKLHLCDCDVMQGGTITGGSHEMGGGIHNGGTFAMYGGTITNNNGVYGGGLWNNYTFYLYGGQITQNKATYGAGLWNANSGDAQLIIYGGSINKNEASYGGGIWSNDNGNLMMKGGEIRENIAAKCGGGVWNQGKNFFLQNGYLYKNYSLNGGGVWTQSTFTMSGGYIVANEAFSPYNEEEGYGGGVWVNDKSLFQMKGGEISGNYAGGSGGGIWVNDSAEFVMQGGTISGNMATIGAGVYVQKYENPAMFRLSGEAAIKGNKALAAGGGMYVKGILETSGGSIQGNHCDSGVADLAVDPAGEFREGSTLPTTFIDVPADAYFYEAVLWALDKNITESTSDITFSPDDKCNTGQILTFLWRAAGCPQVKTSPLLADVKKEDPYYMAAYWAQSLDILERAVYPNFSCSRMSAIYFVWCAAGRPACSTPLTFTDTNDSRYTQYYEAIAWAVQQGIANGTSDTTFSPGKSYSRAEFLTLLWKATSKGLI